MSVESFSERSHADLAYRRAIFKTLLVITASAGLLFSVLNFYFGDKALALLELGMVLYSVALLFVMRRSRNLRGWILAFLLPFLCVMMFALAYSSASVNVFIWVLLIPLVAHLLVGRILGIAISVGFIAVAGAIYLWRFHDDPAIFNVLELANVAVSTFTVLVFSHVYELTRERSERRLRKLATTDGLTGLANRTRFSDVFAWERNKALRENYPLSLIMIDLDYFKSINDSYGHEAGDEVLKHVSALMAGRLRSTDLLCRMGGEEFAIMAPNITLAQVEHLARELQKVVADTPCIVAGQSLKVTFSAGIARLRHDGDDLRALFSAADRRMYQSKAEGRDRITSVDPDVSGTVSAPLATTVSTPSLPTDTA